MDITTIQQANLRYLYIGHAARNQYMTLESDLTPNQIIERIQKNVLTADSFTCKTFNWSGIDKLERICLQFNCKPNIHIQLPSPIIIHGTDYDQGRTDEWNIKIHTISTTSRAI